MHEIVVGHRARNHQGEVGVVTGVDGERITMLVPEEYHALAYSLTPMGPAPEIRAHEIAPLRRLLEDIAEDGFRGRDASEVDALENLLSRVIALGGGASVGRMEF